MDERLATVKALAEQWRAHCAGYPDRFAPLDGPARKQLERAEEQCIDELTRRDLPLASRAAALRSILELRHCTARELDAFFVLDAEIVVAGLSLLIVPAPPAAKKSKSRPAQVMPKPHEGWLTADEARV